MFENQASIGSDTNNRESNSRQAIFSVADMSEFRPPSVDRVQMAQASQDIHSSDKYANYKPETLKALNTFDSNDIGGFAKQFKDASSEVQNQISNVLRSAGIEIKQDGDALRLSYSEKDSPTVKRTLAIKPDGSMVPELSPSDVNLNRRFQAHKNELAASPSALQIISKQLVQRLSSRPETRAA